MDYTILGRTGLKVSVAGLGGGGPSRLGLRQNKSPTEAVAVVRRAIDLGVNFIDTAEWYGTEPVVGAAIASASRAAGSFHQENDTSLGSLRSLTEPVLHRLEEVFGNVDWVSGN